MDRMSNDRTTDSGKTGSFPSRYRSGIFISTIFFARRGTSASRIERRRRREVVAGSMENAWATRNSLVLGFRRKIVQRLTDTRGGATRTIVSRSSSRSGRSPIISEMPMRAAKRFCSPISLESSTSRPFRRRDDKRLPGWLSASRPPQPFWRRSRSQTVSPVARALSVVGLLVALLGLALAYLLQDRYLGIALLVVGAFLLVLP